MCEAPKKVDMSTQQSLQRRGLFASAVCTAVAWHKDFDVAAAACTAWSSVFLEALGTPRPGEGL